MDTWANSGEHDEMLLNAAFHQGLHCLLRLIQSSGTWKSLMQCAMPCSLYQTRWKNSLVYTDLDKQNFSA